MQNEIEAINFLEEQLNEIHHIKCLFISNHGINMKFILNVNKLDLSKNHPDELYFYNKEGNYLMDYIKKRNECWLSGVKIWSKLVRDFGLKGQEIEKLTKGMLESHFKFKVDTIERFFLM